MKKYLLFSIILPVLFLIIGSGGSKAQTNFDMRSYITPEKKVYMQGETIRINFSGFPGFEKDWIGIYKQAELNRNYITWKYTGGNKQGAVEFEVPKEPGKYELRGFADNQYVQFVTSAIITVRPTGITAYNTDWSGVWRTSFSEMTIDQSGNTISGNYGNNKIIGSANGNIITGWWKEARAEGRFEFVMSADGKTFTGKYGNNYDEPSKAWNGIKIITSGRAIQTQIPKKNNDTPIIRLANVPKQVTATDLAGMWDATGYTCESKIALEKIKITIVGNKLVAVKITGDNCVPAGEITWEGTLSQNIISGRGKVSSGPRTAIRWLDGITINVIDKNTLQGFLGVTYRRSGKQTNAEPVSAKAATKPVAQEKWLITYTYKNGPAGKFYAVLKSNKKWDYANGSGNGETPQIVDYGNWTKTGSDMIFTWKETAFHGTYKGKYNGTSASGTMERIEQYINGTWTARKID